MSKTTPKRPAKNDSVVVFARVSRAIEFHGCAESAFRHGALYAALCGIELQALKQSVAHGQWEPFVEEHFKDRLALRDVQRYMQVAEGLKLKARRAADGEISFAPPKAELDAFLAKHQAKVAAGRLVQLTGHFERRYTREVWALLQTPAHRLTDEQRTRLAAAVESIADGETMASLIEAYRLSKKATGSGAKGGYQADAAALAEFLGAYHNDLIGTAYADLPAEVQAHFRKWAAQRLEDPAQMAFDFCRPAMDVFEHPDFEATLDQMPESEAHRFLDHLEAAARKLRARFNKTQRRAA